jgi:hypothetical protein
MPENATGMALVVSNTESLVIPIGRSVAAAGTFTVLPVPVVQVTILYAEIVDATFIEIGAIWLIIIFLS